MKERNADFSLYRDAISYNRPWRLYYWLARCQWPDIRIIKYKQTRDLGRKRFEYTRKSQDLSRSVPSNSTLQLRNLHSCRHSSLVLNIFDPLIVMGNNWCLLLLPLVDLSKESLEYTLLQSLALIHIRNLRLDVFNNLFFIIKVDLLQV